MVDSRIGQYQKAAIAMCSGRFDLEIPLEPSDELSDLGQALKSLGDVLERRFEELSRLTSVTERINAGILLDEVLDTLFETFRPLIPYSRIGFALLDDERKTLRARWARSDSSNIQIYQGYSAPMAGSSLEQIQKTGQPRILGDLEIYLAEHPTSDSTRRIVEEGMRSSLTCPLIAEGEPIGFIFFSSMNKNEYEHSHVALYQQLAGQLAMIIEKSRLYEELVRLNELKNSFLGIVAHDLRSPLSAIRGYAELLTQAFVGDLTEKQLAVLQQIISVSDTMNELVGDLLDVAAIESGHLELQRQEVDLRQLIAERRDTDRLLARAKTITLVEEIEDEIPKISIDPRRIGQVLDNLLGNALKFSPRNTTVTLGLRQEDDQLLLSVRDEGPGIPIEEQERLFDPFQKTSVRPSGQETSTGLGLAIAHKITCEHGGELNVESRPGAGATFTVRLPV